MSILSKDMLSLYSIKCVITYRNVIFCFAISSMKGDFTGKMLLTDVVKKQVLSMDIHFQRIDNKAVGYLSEKRVVTVVSEERAFNSEQLRFGTNGFEFINKILTQDEYETNALEMKCEELLQKDLEYLRLDATISDGFLKPMLPKTIKRENDSDPYQPTENQTSKDFDQPTVNQALQKTELPTPEQNENGISKKTAQSCCICLEQIKSKKFFDERRFGIMEKCDCMVCYGCVRKCFGVTSGVIQGPVECPLCSTRSNSVVASARWIEGKDKIGFFKEYNNNFQRNYKKLNLQWIYLPTKTHTQTTKSDEVAASARLNKGKDEIGFLKECDNFQPTYSWFNFPAKTDAICANVPKFVAVC